MSTPYTHTPHNIYIQTKASIFLNRKKIQKKNHYLAQENMIRVP